MTEKIYLYGVIVGDGIAAIFATKEEAIDYTKRQHDRYGVCCLLVTCTMGIDA